MKSFCSINIWQETEIPVFEPSSNVNQLCKPPVCVHKIQKQNQNKQNLYVINKCERRIDIFNILSKCVAQRQLYLSAEFTDK